MFYSAIIMLCLRKLITLNQARCDIAIIISNKIVEKELDQLLLLGKLLLVPVNLKIDIKN